MLRAVQLSLSYAFSALVIFGCNVVLGNEKGELRGDVGTGRDQGTSTCTKGFADCNDDPSDGCETDLSEPSHCGSCDATCGAGTKLCVSVNDHFTCASGCPAEAPALCGYRCVDRQTNAAHCGECEHACPTTENGEGVCRGGRCQLRCAVGFHGCSGQCVKNDDPAACGDACTPCRNGPHGTANCERGVCGVACTPGFGNCDKDPRNGCETALLEDGKHCGGCNRPCTNAKCVGGLCLPFGGN